MIRRPPRSTLFPTRRSSDLSQTAEHQVIANQPWCHRRHAGKQRKDDAPEDLPSAAAPSPQPDRSEEHTSELQSLAYLVCRLLLEKKKKNCTNNEKMMKSRNR